MGFHRAGIRVTEQEIADICDKLAEGKSLRAICREAGLAESSVRRWIAQSDTGMAHSARARELGCDALADECLDIADGTDPSDVKRIRIDTRLRLIGKWSQRYSDKLAITNKTEVTHRYDLDKLGTDRLEQLERILADARTGASGTGAPEPAALH